MNFNDWDISFCQGKIEQEENGIKITIDCPVKNRCHRFWTEEHTKEAIRTNDLYHSFIMPGTENITEMGCDHFWEEKG